MNICTVLSQVDKDRKMRKKKIPSSSFSPIFFSFAQTTNAIFLAKTPSRKEQGAKSMIFIQLFQASMTKTFAPWRLCAQHTQNPPPTTYPIRNMPNKKVNVEISAIVAKNFPLTFPSFANIKKIPSRVGETQAHSHRRKRGKIEKCWTKKSTFRSPLQLATNHCPLLLPHPLTGETATSEKTPPRKTP
jgi:hypothetical protein